MSALVDAGVGADLVGFYAAGPTYRGFANSFGQRNWHEVESFNLEWGLYQRADEEMLAIWDTAVAETRTLITEGWA